MKPRFPLLFLLFFSRIISLHADACAWTGAGDGINWSDGNNWSCGHTPGTADDAYFYSGTITLDVAQSVKTFAWQGGTLQGAGVLTITENMSWSGGTNFLQLVIASGGTAYLSPNLYIRNSGTFTNNGIATWNNGFNGYIQPYLTTPGTFVNNGTFNIPLGGQMKGQNFDNFGILNKTGGQTYIQYDGLPVAFNNKSGGMVNVSDGGYLEIQESGTHDGGFNIAAGLILNTQFSHTFNSSASLSGAGTFSMVQNYSTLNIQTTNWTITTTTLAGGVATIVPNLSFSNLFLFGGTLSGAGIKTVSGNLIWLRGTNLSQIVLAPGATADISPDNNIYNGGTFTNNGTATWTDWYINPSGSTPGTWVNNGTFNIPAGGQMSGQNFDNYGTLNKTGGYTIFTSGGLPVAFNNKSGGTVNLSGGYANLQLSQGGTHAGSFVIGPNETLTTYAPQTFQSGASMSGAGTFYSNDNLTVQTPDWTIETTNLGGGINDISPNISFDTLNCYGGSLTGAGTKTINVMYWGNTSNTSPLIITDSLRWTGGSNLAQVTINSAAIANVFPGTVISNSGTITNHGTLNWSDWYINPGATPGTWRNYGIFNTPTGGEMSGQNIENYGTFNESGTQTVFSPGGFPVTFINKPGGTVNVAGTSLRLNLPFLNENLVNIQSGALDADNVFDNTGTGKVKGNATLDLTHATFSNSGDFAPGASPGILGIIGDYLNSTLEIDVAGTDGAGAATGHDQLVVTGNITLGGDVEVSFLNGFAPPSGTFVILTYTGTASGALPSVSCAAGCYGSTLKLIHDAGAKTLSLCVFLATAGADIAICSGQSATLTASSAGTTTPFTYLWNTGATTASISVSPTSTTTYTVTVTDVNGCTDNASVQVKVAAASNTWNGAGDAVNWSNAANWSDGIVPMACQEVSIPAGGEVTVPAGFSAVGKTLEVVVSGQLTVVPTGTLLIEN